MSFSLLLETKEYFRDLDVPWYVCGGWAIDLFIGRQTRPHKDLDITVFRESQAKCLDYMLQRDWNIETPTKQGFVPITGDSVSERWYHYVWCMKKGFEHRYLDIVYENGARTYKFTRTHQTELDYVEVLFNKCEDGQFIFKRNPTIKLDIDKSLYERNGLRYLAPEWVLLYKSKYTDDNNNHDMAAASGLLSDQQKGWLKSALLEEYGPDHAWLSYV